MFIKASDRYKHFLYVIPICLLSIIIPTDCIIAYIAVVTASCLEFKDYKYSKNWDWIDYVFTILGGILINIIYATT